MGRRILPGVDRRPYAGNLRCLIRGKDFTLTRQRHPLEIVCHRGANRHAPENTLAAAQLCVDWGADTVEIDVNTSSDGVE